MSANIIVVVVLCKVKWETGLTTATFTRFFPLGNKPLHWKQYCWRLSLSLSLFGSAAFTQYAIFKSWLNDVPKIWVLSKREKEPLRLQATHPLMMMVAEILPFLVAVHLIHARILYVTVRDFAVQKSLDGFEQDPSSCFFSHVLSPLVRRYHVPCKNLRCD